MLKGWIFTELRRLADGIRCAARKSVILRGVRGVYPKCESAFREGRLCRSAPSERWRNGDRFFARERLRKGVEESLIKHRVEGAVQSAFHAPLPLYALFFCGFVLSAPVFRWLLLGTPLGREELLFALGTVVVTLPARAVRSSLWQAMGESLFLGGWQREIAYAQMTAKHARGERREPRKIGVLLASFTLGALTVVWSARGILLLLAAAVFLLTVRQMPEVGILCIVAGFPLVQILPNPTALLIALALLTELSYFAKALVGRRVFNFGAVDIFVLLFALCYLFAAFCGAGGREGIIAGIGRFVAVMFWFPVRNLMGQKRWRRRIFFAAMLSATLCSVIGVMQYFFGDLELKWVDVNRFSDIGGRVVSTFANPNILSVYLLSVLPVCLSFCVTRTRRSHDRALGFLSLFALLLCILFTWTRGAWLAAPISVILFLLCCNRTTATATFLFALPITALLPFFPSNVINRFISIGRLSDTSVCYRLYTWRGTLRLIGRYPWGIGAGERAFALLYPDLAVSGTEKVPHTHQLFLQVTAELGVAGGVVFCLLLLLLFFAFCHALPILRGESRTATLTGGCGLLGCLILGLFDYIWYCPAMMLLFFFLAAMMIAVIEKSLARKEAYDGFI